MKKLFYILMPLIIFISGCAKDAELINPPDPNPPNINDITINSSFQYYVTIGGTTFSQAIGSNGYEGGFSQSSFISSPLSSVSFGSSVNNPANISKSIRIFKNNFEFSGSTLDTAAFKVLFETGTYSLTKDAANGFSINWVDEHGDLWATDMGTADQTGSNFEITDVINLGLVNDRYEVKIKAKFNCKLYNESGQNLVMTEGVYVGRFQNLN